ncbi:MAG: MFS transporter [Proteobacteria bacterium]|jgi:Na+/melibiose symporter-like transporter|nr:MFS transporter [Pseudomonadota bacterium]NCX75074.1 MFS transporter [Pseudomonadota bacterium]
MLSNQFKFQYSVGAVANGIKTDMFTFFLLFFYSRVIGLDPLLASLAIGAALIVDSITDPLMGTISDRTNTKLGRRHPYMLVSFIPVSIFYILLFTPKPDWDITQNQLFWWMFVCASFTRIGMTLFEVPHRSFGAEITKDYVERTKLFSWREMFAWVAGISNAFLAYNIFFRSTPEYPYGQLNPESYFPLALTGAIFMVLSLLYSSITTTNKIENLSKWTEAVTLKQIIKELKIAISNKSFILFFLGSLTLSISWGLLNSLTLFINTDFWGLKGSQIGIFLYIYFGAAFLAFYITPKFVALIGKRNFVLLCVLGVALSAPIAFISYNLGLTPEKGTTTLVLFLCVPLIFISTLSIAGNMARDAMIGDIADEVDLQSGKRQEGVLYSAVSFVQKVNTAIGSLTGGLTLWVLNITAETPTYDQAYSLFFVQGVIGPILLIIPILFFYFYSLDKKRHSEILRQLKERS